MSKQKISGDAWQIVETGWRETILICRKCSKKLDGGYGPDGAETLRTVLRGELRARGARRDVRLVEAGCFGLCPKKAVTLALGSRPGELLVFGQAGDPAALLDHWQIAPGT